MEDEGQGFLRGRKSCGSEVSVFAEPKIPRKRWESAAHQQITKRSVNKKRKKKEVKWGARRLKKRNRGIFRPEWYGEVEGQKKDATKTSTDIKSEGQKS